MEGKKVAVSLCVLETDDEFLIIHRGKKKQSIEECVNMYISLDGKLVAFETPEYCCIRKVK